MLKAMICIVAILMIFVLILFWELHIEEANDYYTCYCKMKDIYKAGGMRCMGIDHDTCKNCPYRKRYQRSIKNYDKQVEK